MAVPEPSEEAFRKFQKAKQYASEPGRFEIGHIRATMISEHGVRLVEFVQGKWSCNCEFFPDHGTCSHVMALGLVLREQSGLQLESAGECEE
jgi:hypothetical protein